MTVVKCGDRHILTKRPFAAVPCRRRSAWGSKCCAERESLKAARAQEDVPAVLPPLDAESVNPTMGDYLDSCRRHRRLRTSATSVTVFQEQPAR
jgi:hypothetical protein